LTSCLDTVGISRYLYFTGFAHVKIVSGTVGLSLGLPYKNTSTCGAFRNISKLVLCAVMIRGRHRGLPVAIDRATLLPWDIEKRMKNDGSDNTIVDQAMDEERRIEGEDEGIQLSDGLSKRFDNDKGKGVKDD
jgi:hypothetical protein